MDPAETRERPIGMARTSAIVAAALLLAGSLSGCSRSAPQSHPSKSRPHLESVFLTAEEEVPMQVGNLVQKVLEPGSTVEALCFAPAPPTYPGPVAQVRSGRTVGYVVVEHDGRSTFDLTASQLDERLPSCERVNLM
jgi:hypothetical protein